MRKNWKTKRILICLEERLINYPALSNRTVSPSDERHGQEASQECQQSHEPDLNDYQQDKYDKVQRKEDLIDKYESRLGEYLIQLTKREMNTAADNTGILCICIRSMTLRRIGDHASYIAHMANEMHDNHTQFSQSAWDELNVVMEAVREEINVTCNAFMNDDKEAAETCGTIRGC